MKKCCTKNSKNQIQKGQNLSCKKTTMLRENREKGNSVLAHADQMSPQGEYEEQNEEISTTPSDTGKLICLISITVRESLYKSLNKKNWGCDNPSRPSVLINFFKTILSWPVIHLVLRQGISHFFMATRNTTEEVQDG